MNPQRVSSSTAIAPVIAPHSADASAEIFRQRYDYQMALLKERLNVPAPDEIYTPNEARLTARPRLSFGHTRVADLAHRTSDPRFAPIVAFVHDFATKAVELDPPATVVIDAHDPNRAFADSLAWMAVSCLIDTDAARRARTMAGLLKWLRALRGWGPFTCNLSLAQSTIGQSLVYDWLYDVLPADERAALRAQIIKQARLSLSENHGGLCMWRGQRFAANHNWAHHSARAFAALTLWGEDDASLAPGELKFWLDDALVDFWIVQHTHSADGAPLEGAGYQDYGLRFFLDFAEPVEHLLNLRESFFNDHVRKLHVRLQLQLPGNRGYMVIADGFPNNWNFFASYNFYRLAVRFGDPRFQLVGDLLRDFPGNKSAFNWRDLFVYDPDFAPAPIETMPLACDMDDFGLFTARRDWGSDAPFFAFRCGTASGESVVRALGYDFGEGHAYPNQGNILFYSGLDEVLPGCNYAKVKLTRDHNLVVFEGRDTQAGRLVGQVGEGGPWFNALAPTDPDSDYDRRDRPARVLAFGHAGGRHHYLCELGGLYRLRDERVTGGVFFPEYLRSVIFLDDGAVVVVDRLRLPVARTLSFRLVTAASDLSADPTGFHFQVGTKAGRIDDFSPQPVVRTSTIEATAAFETPPRAVASLLADDVREAVFAVVLGVGAAAGRYRVATDASGYTLTDSTGAQLHRIDWPVS